MKRRTRVTIVTRQTVIARSTRVRCQQCGAEVPIVTAEKAAGVLQTSPREIHGLLASGDLHAVEELSGENLICGNSISAATNEAERGAVSTDSERALPAQINQTNIEGERQ